MIKSYNAQAIWLNGTDNMPNQYAVFRKKFFANRQDKVTAFICADTQYACFVNEKFIYCGQYSGVNEERYYDEIDITKYVRDGMNELFIAVYYQGKSSAGCISAAPMLIFAIDNGCESFVSDTGTLCQADTRYANGEMELISPQMLYTFHYNALKTNNEWQTADEVDASGIIFLPRPIHRCNIFPRRDGKIIAQGFFKECGVCDTVAERMQNSFMQAKETAEIFETDQSGPLLLNKDILLREADNGVYIIFDLESETSGFFEMELTAKPGTVLYIAYGEHLDDLRVRAYTGRRNFAFSYVCKEGKQKFTHYFKRVSGRYLQVNVCCGKPLVIHALGLLPCEYPFAEKPSFKGDRLFEKIYRASVKTLKLCFHEHYEDCPWREQAMYMMDSRLQMLCGYFAFEDTAPQKDALRIFKMCGDESGCLPLTAPCLNVGSYIPAFTLMWITALKEYLDFSGDINTVRELLEYAGEIVRFFHDKFDGAGIRISDENAWNFYDWAYGLDNSPWGESVWTEQHYDAPIMLYYIMALQSYAVLLETFGRNTEEVKQEEMLIKECVNKLFWVEDMEMYQTYSAGKQHFCELVQSLAICTDTVPANLRGQLMDKLSEGKCGIAATLSMLFFKYEALLTEEKYYEGVFDDIEKKWGKMLMHGATSFWETEDGGYAFRNGGSLCHGWSAIPIYFLKKYLNRSNAPI
ncbi:MAG: hypothetical protein J6N52_14225 [Clostridia bacterium]|nr:hypothetical protein [Clostridia bacterium]